MGTDLTQRTQWEMAWKNMKGKLCDVTDGKMEKSDPKVFWESPSQCIYSMVLGFFDPR